jgi:hypothetical protein
MAEARQYPRAATMNLIARLKLVAQLHARGFSTSRIATELDYDRKSATRDVAAIRERYREFDDLDAHLRDVQARTGEQLQKLNEQEAVLWKQLDWIKEWVVQTDGFGAPIYEHDENGDRKSEPLYGPRKPGSIPQIIGQIQSVNKQQAELLGLLNKNIDITMKLELTERVQVIILDSIKSTDPSLYTQIVRQIKAAKATLDTTKPLALTGGTGRNIEDVLDVEYQEA